ncbi:hypothetical protein A3E76_00555 [Candidatus Saccharibacteria bacterium RIFCSPHIGHO2_12_FULL_44_22]|nr:MAG: hypothetical protein A3E76_00555 [Candidatus Saccharibacteria bacterium RIFCSPHIGHO2_12_FULL_44_22]
MKKATRLSAQRLRLLLIASIVAVVAITSVGFYFVRIQLMDYAESVHISTLTAQTSDKNVANLEILKTKLAQDTDTVERTGRVVADSKSYAYQDQIIKDLNQYASKAGITISGYTFGAATTGATTPAPAPATNESGEPTTPSVTTPVTAAPKSITASVNVKSPTSYAKLMNFVHLVEQNLTKMQLSGISMTKEETAGNVTVSALNIEVYVR